MIPQRIADFTDPSRRTNLMGDVEASYLYRSTPYKTVKRRSALTDAPLKSAERKQSQGVKLNILQEKETKKQAKKKQLDPVFGEARSIASLAKQQRFFENVNEFQDRASELPASRRSMKANTFIQGTTNLSAPASSFDRGISAVQDTINEFYASGTVNKINNELLAVLSQPERQQLQRSRNNAKYSPFTTQQLQPIIQSILNNSNANVFDYGGMCEIGINLADKLAGTNRVYTYSTVSNTVNNIITRINSQNTTFIPFLGFQFDPSTVGTYIISDYILAGLADALPDLIVLLSERLKDIDILGEKSIYFVYNKPINNFIDLFSKVFTKRDFINIFIEKDIFPVALSRNEKLDALAILYDNLGNPAVFGAQTPVPTPRTPRTIRSVGTPRRPDDLYNNRDRGFSTPYEVVDLEEEGADEERELPDPVINAEEEEAFVNKISALRYKSNRLRNLYNGITPETRYKLDKQSEFRINADYNGGFINNIEDMEDVVDKVLEEQEERRGIITDLEIAVNQERDEYITRFLDQYTQPERQAFTDEAIINLIRLYDNPPPTVDLTYDVYRDLANQYVETGFIPDIDNPEPIRTDSETGVGVPRQPTLSPEFLDFIGFQQPTYIPPRNPDFTGTPVIRPVEDRDEFRGSGRMTGGNVDDDLLQDVFTLFKDKFRPTKVETVAKNGIDILVKLTF